MPLKRSNPSHFADGERTTKKAATGTKKATTPRLKKSSTPDWNTVDFCLLDGFLATHVVGAQRLEYSQEKPTGEWSKKCTERWW
jgi:hypothetical protein